MVLYRLTIADQELEELTKQFGISKDQINAWEKSVKSPSMADRKLGKNVSDLDNNVVEIRGVGKGKAETPPDYWQLTLPESNTQDPADL